MSVQLPEVVVVFYLGMLAHVALPDTRPSWASNPGSMPKDRFWPIVLKNPARSQTANADRGHSD